ncbi:disease resistance protein RPP4-like [Prunus yedoensis var. nudiflora]|uniref:Disease resistance protein RPP4-like n=1 Tax=Prunus yedoensis var. nudiflora TaxID=2094558 RepID=A0A314UI96_PRUYE|nr:disease resistance protein RPP4-like [Prunus yedoensis var. nudiflora]
MGYINLSRCPKLVTLPNKLISEVLSSAESLPLEVRTNANSPHDGDFVRPGVMQLSRSFGVTIVGKGLRIKSIGAHLAPISVDVDQKIIKRVSFL